MLHREQVDKITAFAKARPVISAIYLFGSHASGRERPKSDIDLGVVFRRDVDGFERINMETEISNLLNKEVHLVDMRKSSPFLRHQIYKYGAWLYDDDSDYPVTFMAKSISYYLDTEPLRKLRRTSLYGE
ncbi:MAG: nucleotidyltransferase domain-containing protein [Deltaproteobacteria bacterium]|nr:MAG: nucleotidyltransferase domain-containing protein [Deltaproteobacteria bacterium]